MSAPIPFKPQPIDPLIERYAAIKWLRDHGFSLIDAEMLREQVEIVRATADQHDAYLFCDAWWRVANPWEFGVEWADTMPVMHDAEPWDISPPDVEPPANPPSIDLEPPKLPRQCRAIAALAWIGVIAAALSLFAMQVLRSNP